MGIRDNEIWLSRGEQSVQLTHDALTKVQAELSHRKDRIAYYNLCPEGEGCTPRVIILDLAGQRLQSFELTIKGDTQPCASILRISWMPSDRSIAAECHINPSLSAFMEIDLATGRHLRDLGGFDFTPSPDGKWVAHVAPMIHFAPPFAKSYYLQLNDLTVYPLPKGTKPFRQTSMEQTQNVVQHEGDRYIGIHGFGSQFAWSPDSTRVAFVDCIFDWVETGGLDAGDNPFGEERNRRCQIAVVSASGHCVILKLPPLPKDAISQIKVTWVDAQRLNLKAAGNDYQLPVPSS